MTPAGPDRDPAALAAQQLLVMIGQLYAEKELALSRIRVLEGQLNALRAQPPAPPPPCPLPHKKDKKAP